MISGSSNLSAGSGFPSLNQEILSLNLGPDSDAPQVFSDEAQPIAFLDPELPDLPERSDPLGSLNGPR